MTDLPRKFTKHNPLNLGMADLPLLLGIYDFLQNELRRPEAQHTHAAYTVKLVEVRRAIEHHLFEANLDGKPLEIRGDVPENIDLDLFNREGC